MWLSDGWWYTCRDSLNLMTFTFLAMQGPKFQMMTWETVFVGENFALSSISTLWSSNNYSLNFYMYFVVWLTSFQIHVAFLYFVAFFISTIPTSISSSSVQLSCYKFFFFPEFPCFAFIFKKHEAVANNGLIPYHYRYLSPGKENAETVSNFLQLVSTMINLYSPSVMWFFLILSQLSCR